MPETLRSFIAFELPDDVLSAIRHAQQGLKNHGLAVRWVRPESIHLTLKFLGDIEFAQIDPIVGKMTDAARGYGSMSLCAKGIGVFPNLHRPRVLWAGLAGEVQQLGELQHDIDVELCEVGFKREKRSFKGHLTLGRFKARMDSHRVAHALEEFEDFETQPFTADRIILFKSELKPTGAVYSKLKHIPL